MILRGRDGKPWWRDDSRLSRALEVRLPNDRSPPNCEVYLRDPRRPLHVDTSRPRALEQRRSAYGRFWRQRRRLPRQGKPPIAGRPARWAGSATQRVSPAIIGASGSAKRAEGRAIGAGAAQRADLRTREVSRRSVALSPDFARGFASRALVEIQFAGRRAQGVGAAFAQ